MLRTSVFLSGLAELEFYEFPITMSLSDNHKIITECVSQKSKSEGSVVSDDLNRDAGS